MFPKLISATSELDADDRTGDAGFVRRYRRVFGPYGFVREDRGKKRRKERKEISACTYVKENSIYDLTAADAVGLMAD